MPACSVYYTSDVNLYVLRIPLTSAAPCCIVLSNPKPAKTHLDPPQRLRTASGCSCYCPRPSGALATSAANRIATLLLKVNAHRPPPPPEIQRGPRAVTSTRHDKPAKPWP